jgi:hypothetical protein
MRLPDIAKRALKTSAALPDLSELPVRVDRETAAKLLNKYYFRIHRRSLERWPLAWRRLNGRAHCETADLFAVAEAMLADAPPVVAVIVQPTASRMTPPPTSADVGGRSDKDRMVAKTRTENLRGNSVER